MLPFHVQKELHAQNLFFTVRALDLHVNVIHVVRHSDTVLCSIPQAKVHASFPQFESNIPLTTVKIHIWNATLKTTLNKKHSQNV